MIPTAEDIISRLGLYPLKVKNIYMFGSRMYGTANENSDYDFLVVANSTVEAIEHRLDEWNIHVHTPDKFRSELFDLNIRNLECLFAPNFAKLQEKVQYADANFKIVSANMVYKGLAQAYNDFHKAKVKLEQFEYKQFKKCIFHSCRKLDFSTQILKFGKIKDYTTCNYIWDMLLSETSLDWEHYKARYLPIKIEFEERLKDLVR